MNLKPAITGSDDYHSILRQAATEGLQRLAGYIAPVLTQDDGLPVLRYQHCDRQLLWYAVENSEWYDSLEPYGTIDVIVCQSRLCCECELEFEKFYAPYVRLWTQLIKGERCECCGKVVDYDDIPF